METNELFEAVLGLQAPWRVARVTFDPKGGTGRGQVDIEVEFATGSRFACTTCGGTWPVHDTVEKTWRHMDLFQHLPVARIWTFPAQPRTSTSVPACSKGTAYLRRWCTWAMRATGSKDPATAAGFAPLRRTVQTIRDHTEGILGYFRRHLTTAFLEGLNGLFQGARARARGYRNPQTYKTMIYLIAGRLDFGLPVLTHSK